MKKLKLLLKELPEAAVRGTKDSHITGICAHSKMIAPGNLFIAKKGFQVDGARFIPEAINAGAVAILTDLHDPFLPSYITQIVHPDVSYAEAVLAAAYYENPSQQLFLTGITGTSGKTTTAFLVRHLLGDKSHPCGMLGTVEWDLGQKIQPPLLTTPDCITNCRLLREMLTGGCRSAVMEVSSQGLDQGRVRNLEFDVGVFTNLTQDHLDYHHTMENYAAAKAQFFSSLHGHKDSKKWQKTAIINVDSLWHETMITECKTSIMTYSLEQTADLKAENVSVRREGLVFDLVYKGKKTQIKSSLIGRFNVYNLLAATGVALVYGLSLDEITEKLKSFQGVPGRLQAITNSRDLSVFVDYSHKEAALENVLVTLRELTTKNIITVFGCGGDRDRSKRPKMGAVTTALSDFVIITSDNPRQEAPGAIIEEILQGCKNSNCYLVEPNRRTAIFDAIAKAQPGDVVLIAGKGHERQQILGGRIIEFDDCLTAREALERV